MLHYPNKQAAKDLINGFKEGFLLGYFGPRLHRSCRNLVSVRSHPVQVKEKIEKEIELGRVLGPFHEQPLSNLIISPIGIVPKSDGGWRMITHLSYPSGTSINDFIDPDSCSVQYTSFDSAIEMIRSLGRHALCSKMDIKSAFRLLRINPADFHLLGFQFQGNYYIDKCLPFGCSMACATFEKFATFLEWTIKCKSGLNSAVHYLDDFLFAGPKNTSDCKKLMQTFRSLCQDIGVPLAEEKTVGPTSCLVFLGLEINTDEMNVKIPPDKIVKTLETLKKVLGKKKVTLKDMQSLVGSLNFCTRAVSSSRAFNRRFYDATIGARKPHHFIRITRPIKEDLTIWVKFLESFNGVCFFKDSEWSCNSSLQLFTDSAGGENLGCGAYFQGHWVFLQWPIEWSSSDIMKNMTFLELVPIILAIYIWGHELQNKKILFWTDNNSLVSVINKQTSKCKTVMVLIRALVLFSMANNFQFKALHIPGNLNNIADSISRKQWLRFRSLAPAADVSPAVVPDAFLSLLSGVKPTV